MTNLEQYKDIFFVDHGENLKDMLIKIATKNDMAVLIAKKVGVNQYQPFHPVDTAVYFAQQIQSLKPRSKVIDQMRKLLAETKIPYGLYGISALGTKLLIQNGVYDDRANAFVLSFKSIMSDITGGSIIMNNYGQVGCDYVASVQSLFPEDLIKTLPLLAPVNDKVTYGGSADDVIGERATET